MGDLVWIGVLSNYGPSSWLVRTRMTNPKLLGDRQRLCIVFLGWRHWARQWRHPVDARSAATSVGSVATDLEAECRRLS